jgi:hypothetical protein
MASPQHADGDGLRIRGVIANISNDGCGRPKKEKKE